MAEKKCSQTDLIKDLGLGSNTVSRLFHDTFTRVDKRTIEQILNYFDCDLADLFEVEVDGQQTF